MPLGSEDWNTAGRPIRAEQIAAPALGMGGLPPQGQPIAGRGGDVWRNFTLAMTDDWTRPIRVDFGAPISVLQIFSGASDELVISWDSNVAAVPGRYRLKHPGNGQLVEVVPFVTTIWVWTVSGIAPVAKDVEVIGKGGRFGAVLDSAVPIVAVPGSPWDGGGSPPPIG